ncbi:MAG: response regulator [Chroococcidiopsidaceae cyanobacterium CP_BM_RX_35]|nr:response regulator [Chroococcidiopsidaceae cyanobacterium CP_BM_RX_35]
MPQYNEREIQLQFLEEAQEYLNAIESGLLGLGSSSVDSQRLDAVLRAAHSIKGGAAMMGFQTLSQMAHRLEDFFKVLRTGKHGAADAELEQMLLLGVDRLGQAIALNRQGVAVDQTWLEVYAHPVFEQLHQRLGDPQPEDAAALLSEDEGQDMCVLLFETEVEECLQRLESILVSQDPKCLLEEFQIAAQELNGLGEMLELPAWSHLCQSVEQLLQTAAPAQVGAITLAALQAWRRNQALILVGQVKALPTQLDLANLTTDTAASYQTDDISHQIDFDLSSLLVEVSEVAIEDIAVAVPQPPLLAEDVGVDRIDTGFIGDGEPVPTSLPKSVCAIPADELPTAIRDFRPTQLEPASSGLTTSELQENTIRVSLKQLEQLNDLFGQLTIERNGLNLHLGRLRNLIVTLSQRAKALEQSNFRLRSAYDQVAVQGARGYVYSSYHPIPPSPPLPLPPSSSTELTSKFDILEMDRYSDLQLLSQEVMESIVQIQEVTSDIEISLEDTEHTACDLTRTSKQMQTSMTQVRMRPFSELVSRFPRVVRDLAWEYGKNVELEVHGGATLIDRTILEVLSDPLLHLLRNAFDHGIETPATRRAAGKPEQGTIEMSAIYRGNKIEIVISDDGAGIDLDKIRAKALRMGMDATELAQANHNDLLELIFAPGFSTAEQVTELSGRGVGMDIVLTKLQQVRGEISLDTQPGIGTTFTITVPFSLSIVRVLLVESEGILLAFPIDAVEEMLLLQPEMVLLAAGQSVLNWDGCMVPLIPLRQWLHFSHPSKVADTEAVPTINQPAVLMVAQGNALVGIQVERYWGEQEVTVRQVTGSIAMPPGFTSCTILGDGRVVPLVDVSGLMHWIDAHGRTPRPHLVPQNLHPQATAALSHKETVMVVDDSINVRRFLALTLEKAGYCVEQAKDGQDALEKLQTGLPIQAIVCDIEMPRLDGYGFLAHIKSQPSYKHLPVVMLTSRSGEKHRQLAMNLGAAAYFSKPFREQELLQTLKQLIPAQYFFKGGS